MLFPKPEKKPRQRAKRQEQNILYRELVKPAYLAGLARGQGHVTARCEVCRKKVAAQIHHKRGRAGDDLLDARHFMGVCAECHARIHAQPTWAYGKGYLSSTWGLSDEDQEFAEVAEDGAGATEDDAADDVEEGS